MSWLFKFILSKNFHLTSRKRLLKLIQSKGSQASIGNVLQAGILLGSMHNNLTWKHHVMEATDGDESKSTIKNVGKT